MAEINPQAQQVESDGPPLPLPIEEAGRGLTIPEIAKRNRHSIVAIYKAIKRLSIQCLPFKTLRLYSPEQADFLLRNMRSPESLSGKRTKAGTPLCPQS